jgi:hypothetical protein
MNDHGTKVQCPKCQQWVSGSHNCSSEIWSAECQDGKVMLVVEEECQIALMWEGQCPADCDECITCEGQAYRPMTVEEVKEWGVELKGTLVSGQPWEHLLCAINRLREGKYTLTCKGHPVKLVPCREGE